MKKWMLAMFVLTMFLAISSGNVLAYYNSKEYQNALTIGYQDLGIFGKYTAKLSDKTAVSIDISYQGWGATAASVGYDFSASALGISGSFDLFMEPEALKGFYLGPNVGVLLFSETDPTLTSSFTYVSTTTSSVGVRIGGKIGYRWVLSGGLVVDLNLYPNLLIGTPPPLTLMNSGIGIGYGAGIGYAF